MDLYQTVTIIFILVNCEQALQHYITKVMMRWPKVILIPVMVFIMQLLTSSPANNTVSHTVFIYRSFLSLDHIAVYWWPHRGAHDVHRFRGLIDKLWVWHLRENMYLLPGIHNCGFERVLHSHISPWPEFRKSENSIRQNSRNDATMLIFSYN